MSNSEMKPDKPESVDDSPQLQQIIGTIIDCWNYEWPKSVRDELIELVRALAAELEEAKHDNGWSQADIWTKQCLKAEAEVKRLREALEFWHKSRVQCSKCRSNYKSWAHGWVEELISAALKECTPDPDKGPPDPLQEVKDDKA